MSKSPISISFTFMFLMLIGTCFAQKGKPNPLPLTPAVDSFAQHAIRQVATTLAEKYFTTLSETELLAHGKLLFKDAQQQAHELIRYNFVFSIEHNKPINLAIFTYNQKAILADFYLLSLNPEFIFENKGTVRKYESLIKIPNPISYKSFTTSYLNKFKTAFNQTALIPYLNAGSNESQLFGYYCGGEAAMPRQGEEMLQLVELKDTLTLQHWMLSTDLYTKTYAVVGYHILSRKGYEIPNYIQHIMVDHANSTKLLRTCQGCEPSSYTSIQSLLHQKEIDAFVDHYLKK